MSRFHTPSSSLGLAQLLRNARPTICIGLVAAVAMHLCFSQLRLTARQHKPVRPLTTRFVKRLPRLTKPLEMKKRPRPKRRQVQRRMMSARARATRRQPDSTVQAWYAASQLVPPTVTMARTVAPGPMRTEPVVLAHSIASTREARHVVDMSLEMVNIDALDTGRYQAMIVQDPTDKRNIKGYLHLALIHVMSVARLEQNPDLAVKHLIEALSEWTDLGADVTVTSEMTSPLALETPWIYILAYKPFELTPAEQAAVGRYLTCGGFLFCDECVRTASSTYITVPRAFLRMVGLGFETQGLVEGRGWHAGRVPEDHPLLHCYFDFDAPPVGYAFNMSAHPLYVDEPMIGVFCRDSLVGIITRRSYHEPWGGRQGQLASRRRALEFGINTIVYALTREGSITRRLMDTVQ